MHLKKKQQQQLKSAPKHGIKFFLKKIILTATIIYNLAVGTPREIQVKQRKPGITRHGPFGPPNTFPTALVVNLFYYL
jgi:hypothetical protein